MKILIFGGTTEGRAIFNMMADKGADVTMSVATSFGRESLKGNVLTGRLDECEMTALISEAAYECVIDATHPFAEAATKNISAACLAAGADYYRLKREEMPEAIGVTYVQDMAAACEMLKSNNEKVLITVGSKELEAFTHVENFRERFYVRLLPMKESLENALNLGFRGSNIICMEGPFDEEMNRAVLAKTGAGILVTKDSGQEGGFDEKVSAALSMGCKVIAVSRPVCEEGYSLDELLDIFNLREPGSEQKPFFPLFVDLSGRKVLMIGGGKVAERRFKTLAGFGADVTVIALMVTEWMECIPKCIKREYRRGDIEREAPFLVIAATNDRKTNREVMEEAKKLNILVSVADSREECNCYFPAIAESESYIAGIVSKNGDHSGVKTTAEKIRKEINR